MVPFKANDKSDAFFEAIKAALAPLRQQILTHPLYASLNSMEDLGVFMSRHVFAVWDFMSLLKRLQRDLTCVEIPWVPVGQPSTRRFINEIVLGEETDIAPNGGHTSHFELYLMAMRQMGVATTDPINRFLTALRKTASVEHSLTACEAPESIVRFVKQTLAVATQSPLHQVAAAFTFGREDLIPDLFRALVQELSKKSPEKMSTLVYYLERHIHLDEVEHTPLAKAMLVELCGDSPVLWEEAKNAALGALESRLNLWASIHQEIIAKNHLPKNPNLPT